MGLEKIKFILLRIQIKQKRIFFHVGGGEGGIGEGGGYSK